jgi:antitoxin (DNA-binding transcriptional repressor) of toxin-antitoxin stability system
MVTIEVEDLAREAGRLADLLRRGETVELAEHGRVLGHASPAPPVGELALFEHVPLRPAADRARLEGLMARLKESTVDVRLPAGMTLDEMIDFGRR